MPTGDDFDKALHREIGVFRYDPGRHHRRRLAAGARARLGGWQAEWPTLAALIETLGSAVTVQLLRRTDSNATSSTQAPCQVLLPDYLSLNALVI